MQNQGLIYKVVLNNLGRAKRLKNIFALKSGQAAKSIRLNYFPYAIDLEPTTRCNLKCSICQVSSWDRKCSDLTFEKFKYIVDGMPSLVKIKLQGMGEPFLNKDFFRMAGYAKTKGIEIHTSSNGVLMDDGVVDEIISSGLASLQVSFDGFQEQVREGALKGQIINNIGRLIAKRGGRKFPFISIWSVAMKKNIAELPEIIKAGSKLRVDYLTLQYYLSYWGKAQWRQALEPQQLDKKDKTVSAILEEASALAGKMKLKFNIYYGNRFTRVQPCMWPWQSLYITADGFVTPCCILTDPRIFNFGNIFEKSLSQIWNSQAYVDFRQSLKSGNLWDFCKGCYSD